MFAIAGVTSGGESSDSGDAAGVPGIGGGGNAMLHRCGGLALEVTGLPPASALSSVPAAGQDRKGADGAAVQAATRL